MVEYVTWHWRRLTPWDLIWTDSICPTTTDKLVAKLQQARSHRNHSARIIAFGWPIPGLGKVVASSQTKSLGVYYRSQSGIYMPMILDFR